MKSFKTLLCTILLSLLLMSSTVPVVAYTGDSSTVYTMYINDERVGIVKFPARALLIYDNIERGQRKEYQGEVFIDSEIHFEETRVGSNGITDDEALAKAIGEAIDIKMGANAISIDGIKICYVGSIEYAQKVIDEIKAPYIQKIDEKEGRQLEEVTFKQDVDLIDEVVSAENIISPEEAVNLILHGSGELKEYEAKQGDSLWLIAHQNGVSVSDLELSNPGLGDDTIQSGDIVKISQRKALLNVVTKEKVHYSKEISFKTEIKEDNTLEKGKTKVIQRGENGQKDIVALVTKEDGQEIARDIIEEKVVKEPVKHIEAKGTKVKPKANSPTPSKNSGSSKSGSSSSSSSGSSNTTTDRGGSGSGSDVAAYAMKFEGYKYVYRTAGPNTFDCSGFTKYVYGRFGVNLPHSSSSQRSVGKSVSKENLRSGDILCFSGHVGLYIGGDKFIHAANKRDGVKISRLSTYDSPLLTARRIFD